MYGVIIPGHAPSRRLTRGRQCGRMRTCVRYSYAWQSRGIGAGRAEFAYFSTENDAADPAETSSGDRDASCIEELRSYGLNCADSVCRDLEVEIHFILARNRVYIRFFRTPRLITIIGG